MGTSGSEPVVEEGDKEQNEESVLDDVAETEEEQDQEEVIEVANEDTIDPRIFPRSRIRFDVFHMVKNLSCQIRTRIRQEGTGSKECIRQET